MSEHEKIREQLMLAAAGVLEESEQAEVNRHLAECKECSRELDGWTELAAGLRRLPTPRPRAGVVERARALMVRQLAAEAERRWDSKLVVCAVLFAWTLTLAGWPIARLLMSGAAAWLDVSVRYAWLVYAAYTAVGWVTAGAALVILGVRYRTMRRMTWADFERS